MDVEYSKKINEERLKCDEMVGAFFICHCCDFQTLDEEAPIVLNVGIVPEQSQFMETVVLIIREK